MKADELQTISPTKSNLFQFHHQSKEQIIYQNVSQFRKTSEKAMKVFDQSQSVCLFKKKGAFYCTDEECESHAVNCYDEKCKCQINHKQCTTAYRMQVLNLNLQNKLIKNDLAMIIEKIREEMQEILCQLQERFDYQKDVFGLNNAEKQFRSNLLKDYEKINSENLNQDVKFSLTGKFLKDFLCKSKLSRDEWVVEQTNSLIEIVDSVQKKINTKFEEIRMKIKMECKKETVTEGFCQSKILTQQKEVAMINQFTAELNYHKSQLIFRGTVDGMSIEQFHSKCDKRPNLLYLVENEFGFKYGAYCPCPISIDRLSKYETDESMSSFVFSLDLNKKAKVINKEYIIRNGHKTLKQQILVSFGYHQNCSLAISSNSLTKEQQNWIHFSSPGSDSSYQTSKNPPSGVECRGTSQLKCKLKEVQIYQIN